MKKTLFFLMLLCTVSFNCAYAHDNDISITTLPSGQKVVIKENHDNPIVKIDTWINTGSINETEKNSGISHFLEHLFFKGTKTHPVGTFDKLLEAKGANVNAATSKDYTHYYIEIPSKDFELAMQLHSDMLLHPEIPVDELEKERGVVIEEISKTKDSPTSRMFDNIYTIFYGKSSHPYKRNVIGTKEIIQNVSREEILNYFNRFYTPDAYTTVIVGDVNTQNALKITQDAFKQAKRQQEKVKYPSIKQLSKVEEMKEKMDINHTHTMIGFLAPKFSTIDDNMALDVLATMLSSGKSSILNQELKEKKQLVLSVSSGNYSQKDSGMFFIYLTCLPSFEKEAQKAVIEELSKIQKGDFSLDILNKAKNQIKTDTYYSRESISNIADDLGYSLTFLGNSSYFDNYLKNVEKVNKNDIIRVANKYLLLDKYAISTITPQEIEIKNLNPFVKPGADNKLIEQKDNVSKYLLENKAVLITKKKTTNSIVAIDISIKGSKALEIKPATSTLAASCASAGSDNFTNAQFATFLDENGIKLGISSSNDIFSISMQTTKDNLIKAFTALDEVLNHPVFSNAELDKIKKRKIQELKAISDSPTSYVFDEFKKLAYKDTIYGQNASYILNHINSVTRDDIVEFYSKVINPENMSIAVVGDVDDNYIKDKLNEIIKPNKKGKKFQFASQKFKPYKPDKNVETTLYKKEVQANWMALGYKTTGLLNRKEIATLNVLNSILGSGMSSRLFVELREKQSLAYTVGSSLSTNVLDGAFITYIGTNANSVEKAKNGLFDAIEKLKTEYVTPKELQDAKDRIMGKLLLSLETNMEDAQMLSLYNTLGLGLEGFEQYKNLINSTTAQDIMDVANKYFNKPYIYTVVLQK
ncbi:insulinase family protein [bacterium]|nr:insulinase family protein [bacterium]